MIYLNHYPFELIPLPYSYNALEPHIDAQTVEIHHNRHLKTYVDNLNAALKPYPQYQNMSLEQLLLNVDKLPSQISTAVKNNAGGVYNHNMYFYTLGSAGSQPHGNVLNAINRDFGSYNNFKKEIKQSGLDRFGSGWAWLVLNPNGKLQIISTPNQDTPLPANMCPVLLVDVWEHAYYLKYKNLRADYLDNWFPIINWNMVEKYYNNCAMNQ